MKKLRQLFKSLKKHTADLKKNNFDIYSEAEKAGMKFDEYKSIVLHQLPKCTLDQIYEQHKNDIYLIEQEKRKFNKDVKQSTDKMCAFDELKSFERYVNKL